MTVVGLQPECHEVGAGAGAGAGSDGDAWDDAVAIS